MSLDRTPAAPVALPPDVQTLLARLEQASLALLQAPAAARTEQDLRDALTGWLQAQLAYTRALRFAFVHTAVAYGQWPSPADALTWLAANLGTV